MRTSLRCEEASTFASRRFHLTCVPPAMSNCQSPTFPQGKYNNYSPLNAHNPTIQPGSGLNSTYVHMKEDPPTKDWFLRCPQIPAPNPRIDTCADNRVRLSCMPVDIRNCTIMRAQYMFDGGFTGDKEVPDQTAH